MRRFAAAVFLIAVSAYGQTAPQILRAPSLSDTQIAFLHADDVWTVSRDGGVARRLTSTAKVYDGPFFSPDGTTIAYAAAIGADLEIFTIPATGARRNRSASTRAATSSKAGRRMAATCSSPACRTR